MTLIKVRSSIEDVNRVALWDKHPDHPGGEVFIAGAKIFLVARTPAVIAALRQGVLVEVPDPPQPVKPPDPPAGIKPRRVG